MNLTLHGNGFIQYILDDITRLHVWHHSFNRQIVDTSIHNHRFGFESTVLEGMLINILLLPELTDNNTHILYTTVPDKGTNTNLIITDKKVKFDIIKTDIVLPGEKYIMKPGDFHISINFGLTVTKMAKTVISDCPVYVAVHKDSVPDNEFDRHNQIVPDWVENIIRKYI